MKTLQRLSAALVLTLILAMSSYAGEMTTGVTSPTPPPPTTQVVTTGEMSTSVTGNMPAGVTDTDSTTTEIVLGLLQSLLALF